jgi:hypothetical protein
VNFLNQQTKLESVSLMEMRTSNRALAFLTSKGRFPFAFKVGWNSLSGEKQNIAQMFVYGFSNRVSASLRLKVAKLASQS